MEAPGGALQGFRHSGKTCLQAGDCFGAKIARLPGRACGVEAPDSLLGVERTPELRGKCEGEKERARAAAAFVAARLPAGAPVWLIAPRPDTSPGARTLARMVMDDGRDLAAMLIAAGLGRPYEGGKRAGWCAESESERRDGSGRRREGLPWTAVSP